MSGQGRLGDKANAPEDAHRCPACPHPAVGPAIQGSPDVNVNKLPALRVDDPGVHSACCAENTWTATEGSATVFINGKAAHRMGDQNRHCGGMGTLIEGSPNVIVGGGSSGGGVSGGGAGAATGRAGGGTSGGDVGGATARVGGGLAAAAAGGSGPAAPAPPAPAAPAPPAPAPQPPAPQPPAPPSPPPALTSDLVVMVTAGGPAAAATVRISGAIMKQARADGSGTVTFSAIPPGNYQISVSAAGCKPGTGAATAVAGQVTTAPVTLTRILTIRSLSALT